MGGESRHPECVFDLSWKPMITLVVIIMTQKLGCAREKRKEKKNSSNIVELCYFSLNRRENEAFLSAGTKTHILQNCNTNIYLQLRGRPYLCSALHTVSYAGAYVILLTWQILSKSHLPRAEPGRHPASVTVSRAKSISLNSVLF